MKRYLHTLILVAFLFTLPAFAQFKDYKLKVGLQGNYLIPGNEFTEEDFNPSILIRPNIGFQLSRMFDLGLGIGYGWLQGEDYGGDKYKSTIIPLDARLIFSPVNSDAVNPYIYIGAAPTYWSNDDKPANVVGTVPDESGFAVSALAGLGIEFALSKNWILDLTAGFDISSSDDINGQATKEVDKFTHSHDRYINLGLGIAYVIGDDCETDEDMDGINKCEEEKLGTDPKNPDTDGDGLKDGEEVNTYKTNPLKADTDGDGLLDGAEVMTHKTDPLKADTDGDGLNDGDEVNKYKTDPLDQDTDKDGLKDGDEVNKYKTDPLNPDTDGDGLPDGAEVISHKTDPLNKDTDGDTLTDGDEVNKYKTNPLDKDTDKGGIDDGVEVNRGTDPLDPFDDIPKMEEGIQLNILFQVGKSVIRNEYQDDLEKALQYMLKHPDNVYELHGYTSTEGSTKFNQKLSDDRANAAAEWLKARGVAADKLVPIGHGETQPILVDGVEDRVASRRTILIIK